MASKRLSLEEILGRLMAQNYQEWDQALRRVAEAQILHEVIVAVKAGCSVYSAIEGILSQVRANARAARVTDLSAALDVREGSSGLLVNASKLQAVEHSLMSKQEEEDNALEGLRAEYMEQVEAVAADLQAAEQEAEQPGNGKEKKQKQPKKARKGHIMTEAARRVGPKPQHPLEIQVERTEARMRWRSWKRLELNALELAAYLTSDEGGRKLRLQYGRNGKSELEEVRKPNGGEEEEPSAKARGKRLASSPTTQGEKRAKLSANGNGTAPLGESEKVVKELHDVRMELGLVNDSLGLYAAGPSIRRSRRQAGIDADSDAEVEIDPAELAQQLENAKVFIRTFKEAIRHKDCQEKAKKVQDTADAEANELYGRLKFVKAQSSSKGSDVEQTNPTSCPICFDDLADVRQTITRCNHRFCSACIHEALIAQGAQATCPLCRTPLTEADLFDAVSEEEAAAQREMQARNQQAAEEYGSKIAVMLEELAIMRDFDPGAKAIVFSSWGRLLRLVGEALTANSVGHTTLAGVTLAKREEALRLFAADPNCTVLTVLLSSSSGAAGLTLTSASVAFLMEPCINPGLEAQASARIFRLGQTRPTRVIRLVAQDTVDLAVLEQQKRKAESGSAGMLADEADQGTLVTLAERLRDMP